MQFKFNFFGVSQLKDPTIQQILSTFEFTESTPSQSNSEPSTTIQPSSTEGWKTVASNGVSFQIPANATLNNENNSTYISWPTGETFGPDNEEMIQTISFRVEDYQGGSRRQQFFKTASNSQEYCDFRYQDAFYGQVRALRIGETGDCYGAGGIVAVVGDKLVIFYSLAYRDDSQFGSWNPHDTIISTLKPI